MPPKKARKLPRFPRQRTIPHGKTTRISSATVTSKGLRITIVPRKKPMKR